MLCIEYTLGVSEPLTGRLVSDLVFDNFLDVQLLPITEEALLAFKTCLRGIYIC